MKLSHWGKQYAVHVIQTGLNLKQLTKKEEAVTMLIKTIISFSIALLLAGCTSQEKLNEKWYQQRWCDQKGGEVEVRMKDKTRCDCLTENYAIEVDFARNWAEAVGQSLHYSRMTGEQAGILLIVEGNKDKKYLNRLENLIEYHKLPITVWTTNQAELD